jgi:predicted AlkP superfamily pyrophosphatase or phosphodiesterase
MVKKKLPLLALTFLLGGAMPRSAPAGPGPGAANDFKGTRVLIIGIDGLRTDALQEGMRSGKAPHLKQLTEAGTVTWEAYAGGPLGTPQQQPTISGPGWTSISTGTWIDRHHVKGNETPPYDKPDVPGSYQVSRAPHFAKYLKAPHPDAQVDIISSWGWMETYLVAAQPGLFSYHEKGVGANYAERDQDVKNKAVVRLTSSDPDVLQLHFDQVDGAGHATGFSPENPLYLNALSRVDQHIGDILTTIRHRPHSAAERWNVLVTTDHGGLAKNHGGQSPEERRIFVIASGPAFPAGKVSTEKPGHNCIPPTVFAILGLPVLPEWEWSAPPFAIAPVRP